MIKFLTDSISPGYLVVCLNEKKDNILMWSHYAKNHTGFCIEYDHKSLVSGAPRLRLLYPVFYTYRFVWKNYREKMTYLLGLKRCRN